MPKNYSIMLLIKTLQEINIYFFKAIFQDFSMIIQFISLLYLQKIGVQLVDIGKKSKYLTQKNKKW